MIIKIVLLIFIIMTMVIWIWKDNVKIDKKILFLIAAYIYCIFLFTMSGRRGILENKVVNLIPGESVLVMLSSPWNDRGGYEYVEAMGNILLFVPLGMFLRKWLKCSYKMIAFYASLSTFLIEYTQYHFTIGTFEIDDVLNNIWGCFIGANIVYISGCLREKKRPQRKVECIASIALVLFNILAILLYVRFVLKMGVVIKS